MPRNPRALGSPDLRANADQPTTTRIIQHNGYRTETTPDGKTHFVLDNGDRFCLEDDDLDLDGVLTAWKQDPSYDSYT